VKAPLEVLEERERQRSDRSIDTSRWQMTRVHEGQRYDLEVDTSRMTAMECGERTGERFGV
jgi:chloramphenicol 3-O phosphotransferase